MSNFVRQLEHIDSLKRLTGSHGGNWWIDLLELWKPSGTSAGVHGLRLAIRNNYLNFYAQGQSVARVGFTIGGEAYAETHLKYAFGPSENGQSYVRLAGTKIWHSKTAREQTYESQSTLREWIENAKKHSGVEKCHVDKLVDKNPSIIDLEMGLPAEEGRTNAPRMDCVALENHHGISRIVFWEAKMINDSRLRSNSEPKVIQQLKVYQEYLSNSARTQSNDVVIAYRNTCRLLKEFAAMASSIGNDIQLDPLILRAAKQDSGLEVDPVPRLVIFGDAEAQQKGNWQHHEDKLSMSKRIPYLVFRDEPYVLRRPEMMA